MLSFTVDQKWRQAGLKYHYQFICKKIIVSLAQVIRFKGKIYILHGDTVAHRVVVINEDSLLMGCCRWTIVQMPNRIGGWHHLVVSGHDMFLVSIATSRCRHTPTNYTIHRLVTSDRTWERVESIGGCVFFLGGIQSTALSAAQAGTHRDCIYVVNQNYDVLRGEGVYEICLRDQTLSLSLELKRPRNLRCNLCWVMLPNRSRKSKRETLSFFHSISTNKGDHATYVHKENKKEEKCRIDMITRPWADMPIELVQLLLAHLYLVDCIRLPSICKAWNSLSNPIQDAKVYPWLMYPLNNNSCMWRLFDPVFEKEYYIDMKWLESSKNLTFHYSKDGWVLASKEDNSLFLINPLKRKIISLPHFDNNCRETAMSFSSAPTCLDCVVLVLLFTDFHVLEISTWSPGEGEWSKMSFNDMFGFYVPCNPVFTRGEFYCYRLRGELSVYNPKKKTLRDLQIKAPIHEMELFSTKKMECHLTESEGDFITVFRNRSKNRIHVFKLDQQNMVWSELDGVGDNITLFLDHRTSHAKSCLEKRCPNLIYLSGFTDECCNRSVTLKTNKYHPEICYNLKQPINCIWIESMCSLGFCCTDPCSCCKDSSTSKANATTEQQISHSRNHGLFTD